MTDPVRPDSDRAETQEWKDALAAMGEVERLHPRATLDALLWAAWRALTRRSQQEAPTGDEWAVAYKLNGAEVYAVVRDANAAQAVSTPGSRPLWFPDHATDLKPVHRRPAGPWLPVDDKTQEADRA